MKKIDKNEKISRRNSVNLFILSKAASVLFQPRMIA